MRVETEEGVLVVFDAASTPDPGGGCTKFVAYYLEKETLTQFVFGEAIESPDDLVKLTHALERDLGIDTARLVDADPRLQLTPVSPSKELALPRDQSSRIPQSGKLEERVIVKRWQPATVEGVVVVMGFDPPIAGARRDPGEVVALEEYPCASNPTPPRSCNSPTRLVLEGLSLVISCNGGGPPPPNPCDNVTCPANTTCRFYSCANGHCVPSNRSGPCASDNNPCTRDICVSGACQHLPEDDGTGCPDDGTECTNDECLGGWCVHPQKPNICDDGRECTNDICLSVTNTIPNCTHQNVPNGTPCTPDDILCTIDECWDGECSHGRSNCWESLRPCVIQECHHCLGCIDVEDCCADGNPCTDTVCIDEQQACCSSAPDRECQWNCTHVPRFPPPEGDRSCALRNCDALFQSPSMILLNDDDDNENGFKDFEEVDTVDGENDLQLVNMAVTGCPPSNCGSPVEQLASWGVISHWENPALRFFRSSNKSIPLKGAKNTEWPPYDTMWVEGVNPTDACGVPPVFDVNCV